MRFSSFFLPVLACTLLVVGFLLLHPVKRFAQARDARRAADVADLIHAIKLYQADQGGSFPSVVNGLAEGEVFMIGVATQGCDDQNAACKTPVTGDANCVDLSSLISLGLFPSVPISVSRLGTWTSLQTGYTITRETKGGLITIRACESEQGDEITLTR